MAGALFYDLAPGRRAGSPTRSFTGFCAGEGLRAPTTGAWEFPDFGSDLGALAIFMEDQVRAHVAHFDPDKVGYESPILLRHDKLQTLRRTFGLGMELERVCIRLGEERGRPLPCGEVDLREIKSLTTGDQWAEKKLVTAAVLAAGIPLPPPGEGRADAADAAAGWVITLHDIDASAASPWIARFTGSLL